MLVEEARRAAWLVLWLDCDREGENIAYEVIAVCRSANPRLTIKRAHFSALTDRCPCPNPCPLLDLLALSAASASGPEPHP